MLTVITNSAAVFTVPPMLEWLVEFKGSIKLDVGAMILKLCLTVLLPLVIGKACRSIDGVPQFVKRHKLGFKLLSIYVLSAR